MDDPNKHSPENEYEHDKEWEEVEKRRKEILRKADEISRRANGENVFDSQRIDDLMQENGMGEKWAEDKEKIREGVEFADDLPKDPPQDPDAVREMLRGTAKEYVQKMAAEISAGSDTHKGLVQMICGAQMLLSEQIEYKKYEEQPYEELVDSATEYAMRVMDEKILPAMNDDLTSSFWIDREYMPCPVSDPAVLATAEYVALRPEKVPPFILGMTGKLGADCKAAAKQNKIGEDLLLIAVMSAIILVSVLAIGFFTNGLVYLIADGTLTGALSAIAADVSLFAGPLKAWVLGTGVLAGGGLFTRFLGRRRQQKVNKEVQRIENILSSERVYAYSTQKSSEAERHITTDGCKR